MLYCNHKHVTDIEVPHGKKTKQDNNAIQLLQGAVYALAIYGYFHLLSEFLHAMELNNAAGALISFVLVIMVVRIYTKRKK